MKKLSLIFLFSSLLVTYFACRKNDNAQVTAAKDPFVTEALSFLDSKIVRTESETLDLVNYLLVKDEKGAASISVFLLRVRIIKNLRLLEN